jgi:hypothetical protein
MPTSLRWWAVSLLVLLLAMIHSFTAPTIIGGIKLVRIAYHVSVCGFAAIQPNVTTWFDSFPCGLYASPMKSLIRLGDNGELLLSMQQHTTGSLAFAYSAISPQVMELFAGTNSLGVKGSVR